MMPAMRYLLLVVLAVSACSKDNSPAGLCDRGCRKVLGCMSAESDVPSCVETCLPNPPQQPKLEELERASCEAILANPAFGLGGAGARLAPGAPAAPAGRPGCAADCTGCVGDGTSCYWAAGGANGIPCDSCCCAPGGPAPVWK